MTRENIDARLAKIKERFDTGTISMTDLLWLIDKVHASVPKGMVRITSRAPREKKLAMMVTSPIPPDVSLNEPRSEVEERRKRWREAAARRKEKVKREKKS